jgi:epoxyqueuosine reductase
MGTGSYYFIAELIIDLELEPDAEAKDFCGTCTRCIDACPTEAIIKPYVVDGSKCISYFTIELKDQLPDEMNGKLGKWIFGCDICQDVCPWNRFSKPTTVNDFKPNEELLTMNGKQWEEITEDVFKKLFSDSPLQRTGYKRLKRNLEFILKPA